MQVVSHSMRGAWNLDSPRGIAESLEREHQTVREISQGWGNLLVAGSSEASRCPGHITFLWLNPCTVL